MRNMTNYSDSFRKDRTAHFSVVRGGVGQACDAAGEEGATTEPAVACRPGVRRHRA